MLSQAGCFCPQVAQASIFGLFALLALTYIYYRTAQVTEDEASIAVQLHELAVSARSSRLFYRGVFSLARNTFSQPQSVSTPRHKYRDMHLHNLASPKMQLSFKESDELSANQHDLLS